MLSPEAIGFEAGGQGPFYPAQNSPAVTSCLIFLFVPESSVKRGIGSVEIPKKGKKAWDKRVKFLKRQNKRTPWKQSSDSPSLFTTCMSCVKPWKWRFTCRGLLCCSFPLLIQPSFFLNTFSNASTWMGSFWSQRKSEGGKHILWNHRCQAISQLHPFPHVQPGGKSLHVSLFVTWGSRCTCFKGFWGD